MNQLVERSNGVQFDAEYNNARQRRERWVYGKNIGQKDE